MVWCRVRTVGAALVVWFSLISLQSNAQPGSAPFAGMAGAWSGTGTIIMTSGTRERLRCRANYDVAGNGNNMKFSLRCASESYNFDLRGDIQARRGVISGAWSEASRNVAGTVSGQADRERIQVVARSDAFSASLALTTDGDRQTVEIRPQGTEISAVSIALRKG
jgi:hypothetical protein